MLAYVYIVSAAVLLVAGTEGLRLCDGDCMNNTVLEICMKPGDDDPRQPIRLLGLFPCNTELFRARGLTPASQMAIRQINDNTSILPGFRLELLVNNSMCAALPAVRSYIFQIDPNNNMQDIHGIIGPGCSAAAIPVAELAHFFNLILVSTASSPDLSNQAQFPTFFRMLSSDVTTVDVNVAVIKEYGWHQVAIVTENSNLFLAVTDELNVRLAQNGINVISNGLSYIDDDDAGSIITTIQGSGARIVIMNVFEDSARMLFCLALARNMIYPEYVWMSYGWYTQNWWLDVNDTGCTVDQMQTAIQRSLAIHHFPIPISEEEDAPTDVGYTPNEFWEIYERNIELLGYPSNEAITQARYFYDAVWMAAFAFNNSIKVLAENGQTLADFTYDNYEMRQVFVEQLSTLSFRGVSGRVVIENRERQPNLRISQYRYDNDRNITSPEFGRVPPTGGNLYYTNDESSDTVWPDGVPEDVERDHINVELLVLYGSLSGLGILFAVFCLVFNWSCRQKPVVKATSPYLNILIIIGVIIIYGDVILFGIDGRVTSDTVLKITCNARIWAASIGYSLLFGPMLAKAVRVYFVVTRSEKDLKQRNIKDWQLILFVVVLMAIDVVVLLIVTLVDATRLKTETRIIQREDGEVPRRIEICSTSNETATTIWIIIWLCYKGSLLLFGVFCAVAIQNVKIKELNDSNTIATSVYCIAAISAALTFIGFFLREQIDVQYVIIGGFMMLTVTVILCVIFVPMIKSLFEDPSGQIKEQSTTANSNYASIHTTPKRQAGQGFTSDQENHLRTLNNELFQLRNELSQLKRRTPDTFDVELECTSSQVELTSDAVSAF